jgi:hypothetical protein
MPLARYFAYVGGVLLTLLFIVNWYLPPLSAEGARADVDRATIRIHSTHKWPKAVVYDTTLPTIVPPATAAVETPAAERVREAFAMVEAPEAAKPAEAAKPDAVKPAKPHVRRARVARAPGNRVASYDTFGWRSETFGSRGGFFGSRNTWSMGW